MNAVDEGFDGSFGILDVTAGQIRRFRLSLEGIGNPIVQPFHAFSDGFSEAWQLLHKDLFRGVVAIQKANRIDRCRRRRRFFHSRVVVVLCCCVGGSMERRIGGLVAVGGGLMGRRVRIESVEQKVGIGCRRPDACSTSNPRGNSGRTQLR